MKQNTPLVQAGNLEAMLAVLENCRRRNKDSDNSHNSVQSKPSNELPAQLPLWPCNVRAMPNDICRSAVFTVRNSRVPRASIQNKQIYVVGDGMITYTGIELRAEDDELVWQQILDIGKEHLLGTWIKFTPYQICMALGWSTNGHYYNKVHECLLRLKATAISIEIKVSSNSAGKGKAVSMVRDYEWDTNEKGKRTRHRLKISPGMDKLFADRQYTHLEWIAYRDLTPIARRLYDYAASHLRPFPLKLETLRKMCESDSMIPKRWRQQVKEACAILEASNLVRRAYVSENDLTHFER